MDRINKEAKLAMNSSNYLDSCKKDLKDILYFKIN